MKLILIRHGNAEDKSSTGKDFDRNLSQKGIAQTRVLAEFLRPKTITGEVYCSSAQRTLQTYHSIENSLPKKVTVLDELYLTSKDNLLKLIWKNKSSHTITIIGHNNGLSELASYLLGDLHILSTSACICLRFEVDSWNHISQATGQLEYQFIPQIN